ncbi:uncharacterized protein LOC119066935 [Bradysia coprophila]|uniref:uncharacterized protein LOC119066935 n=1 Tax=Bradysia coprophila TaxID=38358 RepID=UPI00187DC8C8|nr:uncharacterized protein LOC119066935 [Bradysia coprophila]
MLTMLWAKESDQTGSSNGIYVNILRDLKDRNATAMPEKKSMERKRIFDLTECLRLKGNQQFGEQLFEQAMECYNRSLCYAEKDSVQMAKAYANRSACFFSMKMYNKCLTDIELAQAANCPTLIRTKLEQRRADCLRLIDENNSVEDVSHFAMPQLSFKSNAKIPFMANVLDLQYNSEFDIHVVAKRDIDVGKTIIVEPFYAYVPGTDESGCSVCGKSEPSNFIPCDTCAETMFCSKECAKTSHHNIECINGVFYGDLKKDDPSTLMRTMMFQFVVRTIAKAFCMFGNVTDFISFVEQCIDENQTNVPSMEDDRSTYGAFLKVLRHKDYVPKELCTDAIAFAYESLMKSDIGKGFVLEAQQNFLAHLIWHHLSIGLLINECRWSDFDQLDSSLTLTSSFTTFSCTPNTVICSVNGYRVLTTVRPIKSDEKIMISRFGDHLNDEPTEVEELLSATKRNVKCSCDRCAKRSASPAERLAMRKDPHYHIVQQNHSNEPNDMSENLRLRGNAIEFLRKFGRSTWCPEIALAVDCMDKCISFQCRKGKK